MLFFKLEVLLTGYNQIKVLHKKGDCLGYDCWVTHAVQQHPITNVLKIAAVFRKIFFKKNFRISSKNVYCTFGYRIHGRLKCSSRTE